MAGNQGRHHHILERSEFRQKVVKLEDEPQRAIPELRQRSFRVLEDLLLLRSEVDLPRRRGLQSAQDMQKRALADTGSAGDRHHLTRQDRQIDVPDDRDLGLALEKGLRNLLSSEENGLHRWIHDATPVSLGFYS
jgi:hypothetical protein